MALPGRIAVIGLSVLASQPRGARRLDVPQSEYRLLAAVAVAALAARFWTYHRVYDDVLILLPMVALFRIVKSEQSTRSAWTAGALLAITLASMLVPGSLLQAPPPWDSIIATERATVWIMVLIFLLNRARRLQTASSLDNVNFSAYPTRT